MATLVNSEGWLTFIGDRHIHTNEDALAYIQTILGDPQRTYWVISAKNDVSAIGIITLIKRDYLPFHDIGFAFLPGYIGLGYAYEATKAVLTTLAQQATYPELLATTLPENARSIQLLQKLGFGFENEISRDNESLLVFKLSLLA